MTRTRAPVENARRRVIAYCRVSTDKQADRGVSLDAQRAKVAAYAALYDLDTVAVEVDAGVSAKSLDRPALGRALDALRAGDADALLIVKLDRLTRSVRDLGDLVDRCNREGWAILSVSEQLDTGSAAGRLVVNVLASVAQWEREATGERTSAALAHKRDRSERVGAVRYGYTLQSDGRTEVPHADEQRVIALARELRAAGWTLAAVADELTRRGHLSRTGRPFARVQVARMVAA